MSSIIRMSRRAVSDIEEIAEKIFYSEDLLEATITCSDVIMGEPSSLMAPTARAVLICFEKTGLFRNPDASTGFMTVLISQEGEEQKVRIFGAPTMSRRARRVFELLEFEEDVDYGEDDE